MSTDKIIPSAMREQAPSFEKKRTFWLDVARVIAIVSITANHAVNRSYDNYTSQISEFVSLSLLHNGLKAAISAFSQIGVPFFLMISGSLLLCKKMEDEKDVLRFYKHNLLPMYITTAIWYAIMYWFIVLTKPGNTMLENEGIWSNILGMLKTMVFVDQSTLGCMWYMPMILCIYTVLPYFSMAIQKMNSYRVLLVPMGIVLISSMLVPNFNSHMQLMNIDESINFNLSASNIFSVYFIYIFTGYFISRGAMEKIPTWSVIAIAAASFAGICAYQLFAYSREANYLVSYNHVGLLICAAFLFETVRRLGDNPVKLRRPITYISRISFGIYFLHILLMETMNWHIDLSGLAKPMKFAVLEVASVGGSVILIWLLSHSKTLKRYLFMIK